MADAEWTTVPPAHALDGSEAFIGLDASVLDFWRFAMADLRTNNVRGYFAEFLVAKAVGARGPRVEWDAYDVEAPDGTTIEVKSSAYVQAWAQRRPSTIRFTGLTGRTWTPETGTASAATYNADLYVFALQTAKSHEEYDVFDVDQWRFYVVPRQMLEQLGSRSIGLSALERLDIGPVTWSELADTIRSAGPLGR